METPSQHNEIDLLEQALNKIAGFVPEPISIEKLQSIISDKVPKAFYYQMLLELLSKEDSREPNIVLAEAKFLVKLLTFKIKNTPKITQPII